MSTTGTVSGKDAARINISHFIQVFNLGVMRGVFPAGHRAYFQLDVNSNSLPALSTEADITLWGERVRTGDAARVAAGGTAMANPAIADVNTAVGLFNTENTAQSALKDAYDAAQEAVEALRPEADAVIKKVWDETETFYNEEEAPSKRRKAREWGVVYVSDVPLTFNLQVNDSASGNPVAGVVCELTQTNNTHSTDANGATQIVSNITGTASFTFTHPDYVTQTLDVNLPDGATAFNVPVSLVHI